MTPKKSTGKIGRPKSDNPRIRSLRVPMTPEEYAELERRADESGQSLAKFSREKLIGRRNISK